MLPQKVYSLSAAHQNRIQIQETTYSQAYAIPIRRISWKQNHKYCAVVRISDEKNSKHHEKIRVSEDGTEELADDGGGSPESDDVLGGGLGCHRDCTSETQDWGF